MFDVTGAWDSRWHIETEVRHPGTMRRADMIIWCYPYWLRTADGQVHYDRSLGLPHPVVVELKPTLRNTENAVRQLKPWRRVWSWATLVLLCSDIEDPKHTPQQAHMRCFDAGIHLITVPDVIAQLAAKR